MQVLLQMLKDVYAFFLMWAVLWMGFASSLLVLFGNDSPYMSNWGDTLLLSLAASVGNVASDEVRSSVLRYQPRATPRRAAVGRLIPPCLRHTPRQFEVAGLLGTFFYVALLVIIAMFLFT